MSENKIQGIMDVTMEKLRTLVDADTVVGTPITVGETTLIPVSKISVGMASGGTDFNTKAPVASFGGGSGAGLTVTPIAFLSVTAGKVRMIPVTNESTVIDRAIAAAPDLVDRFKEAVGSKKNQE